MRDARASARGYFAHAGALAVLAGASALLPSRLRLGVWVPLHAGFTGAATLGVAGASTFFVATLRRAPVPGRALRRAHVGWHEAAVGLLIGGRAAAANRIMLAGGAAFLGSVAWIACVLVWQMRRSEARRYTGQPLAYLAALACLGAGSILGLESAGGWTRATDPLTAHVTINLFGFLGIVLAGTEPRFVPMMVRVRIRTGFGRDVPWVLVAAGVGLAAFGATSGHDSLQRAGFGLGALGAWTSLAGIASDMRRSNVTLEADAYHTLAASAWYALGWTRIAAANGDVTRVAQALAAGFVVQAFCGAWAYFVPALQHGGSAERRAARAAMSSAWMIRLLLLNAGAVALFAMPARPEVGWTIVLAAVLWFAGASAHALRVGGGIRPMPDRSG